MRPARLTRAHVRTLRRAATAAEVLTAMGNDGKIDPAELLRILARHVDVARMDHKLRVIAGGSR